MRAAFGATVDQMPPIAVSSLTAIALDVVSAIRKVQAPTLVLGGTQDALVPAKVLRAVLAYRRDWQGDVLDARRHALMLEDPQTYLRPFDAWGDDALAA